jgi:energy-coupling factor transporter ATP-binding protein EcfA2
MLRLDHIAVAYAGSASDPVLADVSFGVQPGEWVAVVGSSGAGKSTLLRIAAGLLEPSSGTVTYPSESGGLALLQQDPASQILAGTVASELAFPLESMALPAEAIAARVAQALEATGLTQLAWRDPMALSGGQQQLVGLAVAIAGGAQLLILDEPTSHLDAKSARRVRDLVATQRDAGCGVLMATQQGEDLAHVDRIVAVHRGAVAFEGTPRDAWADLRMCRRLGIPVPSRVRLEQALQSRGRA